MRTKSNISKDTLSILKAARKKSREDEIAAHGKPICHAHVERNRKTYTRKTKHKKGTEL